MPIDSSYHDDDDEAAKEARISGVNARFKEFDCPGCNANNPADPPFGNGDEVLCNYCGTEFAVKVNEDGKAKFREV